MMRLSSWCIILISCYLCGCSLFSITKPEERITLFAQDFPKTGTSVITASIAFTNTTANPFLNTNVIIIRNGNMLSKLKGAVWTDSIASLVNYTLLSALRSCSQFTSISTDSDGIIASYTVQTSLTQWNIEVQDSKYYVVGELYANIVSKKKGKIFAQNTWSMREEIPNLDIHTVSTSFQHIIEEIIPAFIQWTEDVISSVNSVSEIRKTDDV